MRSLQVLIVLCHCPLSLLWSIRTTVISHDGIYHFQLLSGFLWYHGTGASPATQGFRMAQDLLLEFQFHPHYFILMVSDSDDTGIHRSRIRVLLM